MPRYESRNDLSANAKTVSISVLNARLADGIDLALLTKQAHWNLKGPNFIALHEMIDGFRGELDEHVDTVAERIVQLGGTALGTTQTVAGFSRVGRVNIQNNMLAGNQTGSINDRSAPPGASKMIQGNLQ